MEAHEVLDAMADVIEERGHTKFLLEDHNTGRVCLFGAYNVVRHGTPQAGSDQGMYWTATCDDEAILAPLLREADLPGEEENVFTRECMLITWNNAVARTPDEVIDACRWAAKRLRDERKDES